MPILDVHSMPMLDARARCPYSLPVPMPVAVHVHVLNSCPWPCTVRSYVGAHALAFASLAQSMWTELQHAVLVAELPPGEHAEAEHAEVEPVAPHTPHATQRSQPVASHPSSRSAAASRVASVDVRCARSKLKIRLVGRQCAATMAGMGSSPSTWTCARQGQRLLAGSNEEDGPAEVDSSKEEGQAVVESLARLADGCQRNKTTGRINSPDLAAL